MEQHLRIISILDIIFGVLAILVGLLLLVLFAVGGAAISGVSVEVEAGLMVVLGVVFGLIFALLGIFQIIVGVKLKQHASWSRIAQIVIAILSLGSIPIGTAFGVYCLWALFNEEGKTLFKTA